MKQQYGLMSTEREPPPQCNCLIKSPHPSLQSPPLHDHPTSRHPWDIFGHKSALFHGVYQGVFLSVDKYLRFNTRGTSSTIF